MSDKLNMLHLIEQLQDLVNKKDKKTCEIFTEMERIMQKIPVSFIKPLFEVFYYCM